MTDTLYQGQAPATKPGEVFALIPKAMAAIGAIAKGQRNDFDRYNFRGIDDIYNAFHGPLSEVGLTILPHEIKSSTTREVPTAKGGTQLETTMQIAYRIYAKDCSYVTAIAEGVGMDRGDKASNKAQTAAFKVLCFQVFMPPIVDGSDSEKDSPERGAPSKPAPKAKAPKVSPLTQAKREALDAIEDIRLGQTDALDNMAFLKKVSAGEYGPDGATTVAQVEALVTMARAGVWELSSGDRIPEEV